MSVSEIVGALVVFLYGLIVGSFLNVVVLRLHAKKSFVKGRSACPYCGHKLQLLDLIPVASWLLLRGKCRYCGKPISSQYPLVEFLTATTFTLSYLVATPGSTLGWVNLIVWLYILASLIVLAVYDYKWMILPNVVLIPAILVQAAWLLIRWPLFHQPATLVTGPLFAAIGGALVFSLLAMAAKGKLLGFGDVKLIFLMGLLLGIKGLILALFLAFNVAAIIAIILMLLRLKSRKDYIAFGPFLAAATVVAYLYGAPLISLYLGFTGLDQIVK